jgi:Endonuclease/Exonuclease/phosphatase family
MRATVSFPSVILALIFCTVANLSIWGQDRYRIAAIGFYNVENLFDLENDATINDEDFLPTGSYLWNAEKYKEKMSHIGRVISELGTEKTPDGVAILGVSEVENRKVLEDLVKEPQIASRNYQIVHYDSPDERGIDVALLYNPKYFKVSASKSLPVLIYGEDKQRNFTRDVLLVSGVFDGEPIHVMVNHWPSRSGGEKVSDPWRVAAAAVCKKACDSLLKADPKAKFVIMGDLNDDPVNNSVKEVLRAKKEKEEVRKGDTFNPFYNLYKKGLGTLAYRDAWSLFDQIILSPAWIQPEVGGYQYFQANVHGPNYMRQQSGQFKGYPFRAYVGATYVGGYSDHFPTYFYLVKKI